jgi:hypothetical protein
MVVQGEEEEDGRGEVPWRLNESMTLGGWRLKVRG